METTCSTNCLKDSQFHFTSDRVAIKANGKSYSYGQLTSSALTISKLFHKEDTKNGGETRKYGGFSSLQGARVGIVAKPSAEFLYPEAELLYVMNNSDISVLLSTEDHSKTMKTIAAKSDARFHLIPPVVNSTSETITHNQFQDDSFEGEDKLLGKIRHCSVFCADDPALIVYTIVHTHKSINSQVRMLSEAWEYTAADHFLHCLPLHHVHGLFNALFAPLYARSSVEFLPKFSVSEIWRRWRESYPLNDEKTNDSITVFTGVPTMYTRLIQGYEAMDQETKESSAFAAQKLRLMMSGSSALPRPVMHQWESITGHRLLERYGMTEFVMAISNPLRGARKAGTVGKPLPGVEAKIERDENDADGVGEICIKSPSLFKEYWNLPQVTKESFTEDGYFKTGDAGRVDEDGHYVILGRTSADIMKVGGYKLSALEIESTLLEHPTVAECCVLGLPDKDYGEAVTAIIMNSAVGPKTSLLLGSLPTRLLIWESLPRNAMGKVNKKELKKSLDHQE
ncbi:BnaC01g35460D [Brassica napus]|uniref:BnaC01g35460D protein n=1 Tax=Brassica napus TaxID=3708 RepID=A0A078GS75_BRANA|nr:BnaC01g35460D [Brassica napus]